MVVGSFRSGNVASGLGNKDGISDEPELSIQLGPLLRIELGCKVGLVEVEVEALLSELGNAVLSVELGLVLGEKCLRTVGMKVGLLLKGKLGFEVGSENFCLEGCCDNVL